jgi:hypothetical protein
MIYKFLLIFLPLIFLWGSSWTARGFSGEIQIQPPSFARTLLVEEPNLLTLRGPAPEGSRMIIKVVGPDRDFRLNKAGKVLGFLWAPVSHGVVRSLPGMYVLLSSGKIADALSPEDRKDLKLFPDFQELRELGNISFQGQRAPEETEALARGFFQGLVCLLQEKGLYKQDEDAIRVAGGQFQARLLLPAQAPLGEYRVSAYVLEEGKARLLASGNFTVRAEGLAAWLGRQAQDSPAFYGIMAVLIALGSGAFVGAIFQLARRN